MKRLQMMGLGLAVSAALLLAVTASASASVPTWFECAKAAKVGKDFTGDYNDKLCTSPNTEGKGKYVLREGVGGDKRNKGKSGITVLHVQTWLGDATVECAKSKDSGVAKLPNLESDVEVTLVKCVGPGGKKCTSAGQKLGFIRLHAMSGEFGYIKESPTVVGLRLELESSPGGAIASFDCEDLEVTVSGALIGVQQKDVNAISKESETVFAAGEYLGEVEYEGHKFAPLVNAVGFEDELEAIAKMEAPPHVLRALNCGAYIESLLHVPCAPEALAGQDQATVSKGEALMLKT